MRENIIVIFRVVMQSLGWITFGFFCGVIFEAVAGTKVLLDQGVFSFLIPMVVIATTVGVSNTYECVYFIKYILGLKNKKGGQEK